MKICIESDLLLRPMIVSGGESEGRQAVALAPGALSALLYYLAHDVRVAVFSPRSRSWLGRRRLKKAFRFWASHEYWLSNECPMIASATIREWQAAGMVGVPALPGSDYVAGQWLVEALEWPRYRPHDYTVLGRNVMRCQVALPSVREIAATVNAY